MSPETAIPSGHALRAGSNRVLIIDDSQSVIMCLTILIKRLGFEVFQAGDGREGLRQARKTRPALIILDIRMPEMDGVETLRELKAGSDTSHIPVVMYSVEGEARRAECEALGCTDYLAKPSRLPEVNRILQKYCAPPARSERKNLRTAFNRYVQLTFEGRSTSLFAPTISEGGVYLKTLSPLPVGSVVTLKIPAEGRKRATVRGTVIYSHDIEANIPGADPGMAVRFDSLSAGNREIISGTIKSLLVGDLISGQSDEVILEDKVAERTRELKAATVRLQELDTIKDLFIASMSHELRTPLNAVIGFTGLLLGESVGPLNGEQKKQLRMVKHSGEHLLVLINDIIDVSKIGAGEVEPVVVSFDLVPLIREVGEVFRIDMDRKGLTLRLDVPGSIILKSDEVRIRQILMNLVSNAVKFSDTGTVSVTAASREESVFLTVTDEGPGIGEEHIDKLFQPFSRLESAGVQKPGTGLGLYLSQKIASLLGGEITLRSTPGEGSEFTLALPQNWADGV